MIGAALPSPITPCPLLGPGPIWADDCPVSPHLRLRLVFAPGEMVGPGKAELLERIDETGSIAAAGRAMGMSYKRAWMLVETMNAMFQEPVVISSRGGPQGGGAQVTRSGHEVISAYRALEAKATVAGADEIARLVALLEDGGED